IKQQKISTNTKDNLIKLIQSLNNEEMKNKIIFKKQYICAN
ncbi:2929_t:CDS:2, partial [Dentiscutata erythropus]